MLDFEAEKICKKLSHAAHVMNDWGQENGHYVQVQLGDKFFNIKRTKTGSYVVIQLRLPPTGIGFKNVFEGDFIEVDNYLLSVEND